MPHELIVLPQAAHSRIADTIRAIRVQVEPCEDASIRRHRHPGDSLYLCRRGEAAVELLVPAENEMPKHLGDFTGVIFLPHGGFFRQFRCRKIDAQLQQSIGAALHQLKTKLSQQDRQALP